MAEEHVSSKHERVLVVDDEENMVHFLTKLLAHEGYEVKGVLSGTEALACIKDGGYDLVLCDLKLPGADGMEVLTAIRETLPEAVVIMITAYGTIPSAIEAMRAGAYDYVTKQVRRGGSGQPFMSPTLSRGTGTRRCTRPTASSTKRRPSWVSSSAGRRITTR